MYKNLNDIYRERLINNDNLDKLDTGELLYLFDIILGDMYKIFLFEDKKHLVKLIEQKYDSMKRDLLSNNDLLMKAIHASYLFYDMELVNKSILMEDLHEHGGDKFLLSKSKLNILDQISYSYRYDLNYFVEIYRDFIKKNPNENELIVEYLADGMNGLKTINFEKYEKFILEFFRCFYKCSLYNKDLSDTFINSLQTKSLREMCEEVSSDTRFLITILQNYLLYETSDDDYKEKIENNFNNNKNDIIIKKLKFKKEN